MLGLILIQTAKHSDGIWKGIFQNLIFKENQ